MPRIALQRWKREKARAKIRMKGMRKKTKYGRKVLEEVRRLKGQMRVARQEIQNLRAVQEQLEKRKIEFDEAIKRLSELSDWRRRIRFGKTRAKWALGRKMTVTDLIRRIDAQVQAREKFILRAEEELGISRGEPTEVEAEGPAEEPEAIEG